MSRCAGEERVRLLTRRECVPDLEAQFVRRSANVIGSANTRIVTGRDPGVRPGTHGCEGPSPAPHWFGSWLHPPASSAACFPRAGSAGVAVPDAAVARSSFRARDRIAPMVFTGTSVSVLISS